MLIVVYLIESFVLVFNSIFVITIQLTLHIYLCYYNSGNGYEAS